MITPDTLKTQLKAAEDELELVKAQLFRLDGVIILLRRLLAISLEEEEGETQDARPNP